MKKSLIHQLLLILNHSHNSYLRMNKIHNLSAGKPDGKDGNKVRILKEPKDLEDLKNPKLYHQMILMKMTLNPRNYQKSKQKNK